MGQSEQFLNDLAYSLEASDEPFWEAAYRKAFPSFRSMGMPETDSEEQRRGIDRRVFLQNDTMLLIDEKKRPKTWGDILLEYISVDKPFKPGWIEKDNAIDFIAYAFMDTQKVYFFQWQFLRRAWLQRKEIWLACGQEGRNGFRIVPAKNRTYTTYSLAIPIPNLYAAVTAAMLVEVS
jgi:hypothetical protein